MPTTLDHLTWFFDSGWGDVITGITVPLLGAGVAAYVAAKFVVHQVRRTEAMRTADRKAEGVRVMADYLLGCALAAFNPAALPSLTWSQFERNALLASAYGFVEKADKDVVRWVGAEGWYVHRKIDHWASEQAAGEGFKTIALADGTLMYSGPVGEMRGDLTKIVAEGIEALLEWQAGERKAEWFRNNLRPDPENGSIRATAN